MGKRGGKDSPPKKKGEKTQNEPETKKPANKKNKMEVEEAEKDTTLTEKEANSIPAKVGSQTRNVLKDNTNKKTTKEKEVIPTNPEVTDGTNESNDEIIINIPTRNTYSALDNHSDGNQVNSDKDNQKKDPPKVKVPPIFVSKETINFTELHRAISAITKDYKIKDIKEFFKVDIDGIEEYRQVVKLLDNKNAQYHTYRLPTEQTIDVVLKHIPTSIEDIEITQELETLGFKIFKIMRITNKEKAPLPIVSVYLYKNAPHNKEIFNLSRLFNCVISVEAKKKSYDIPQCFNCQRYGHTRNYCKQRNRCMKCAGNHLTKSCNQSPEVKCVNCGETHTSNFKGCTYYTNLKKMRFVEPNDRNKTTNQNPEPPILHNIDSFPRLSTRANDISNSTFSNADHSYARILNNGNEEPPITSNLESNNMVDAIYEIIKPIIAQVIEKIKPLIQNVILSLFNGSK